MLVKGIKRIICLILYICSLPLYICYLPIKVVGWIGILFYGVAFGIKGWACDGRDNIMDELFLDVSKSMWSKEADFITKLFKSC